jgi:uncharacterized protein (DUF433 family)
VPDLLDRITVNPAIFGGKPIIRGRRLAVEHVLGMLAAGDDVGTILEGYPWLEREDVLACLEPVLFTSALLREAGCGSSLRRGDPVGAATYFQYASHQLRPAPRDPAAPASLAAGSGE